MLVPLATSTSVGESPDSLNLISRVSSRAGKCVHPRGRSRARCTVSAAEDFRKASPELSSSSEESRGLVSRVICVPQAPLSTSLMPHGPNYGTAESSSEIEGGSVVAGTCDTLVIRDYDNLVTCDSDRDSLPQASQPVTSNIVTPNVTFLSGHFGYLENDAKVLASFVLRIARFIQKHPIGSRPIEQFPPILGAGSIMWHLFQTVSAAGWDRFKVSPQPDSPHLWRQ